MRSGANSDAVSSTNITYYALPTGHPRVDATVFFTGSEKFRAAEVEVFRVLIFIVKGSSKNTMRSALLATAESAVRCVEDVSCIRQCL